MKQEYLLSELKGTLNKYSNDNGENGSFNPLLLSLGRARNYVDLNKAEDNLKELENLVTKTRNIIWEDNLNLVKPIANKYCRSFSQLNLREIE